MGLAKAPEYHLKKNAPENLNFVFFPTILGTNQLLTVSYKLGSQKWGPMGGTFGFLNKFALVGKF